MAGEALKVVGYGIGLLIIISSTAGTGESVWRTALHETLNDHQRSETTHDLSQGYRALLTGGASEIELALV